MSEKKSLGGVLMNGIVTENPTFRLVLGTCPTLAVTTSALNGLGMGAAATFVLVCSNVAISMLRKFRVHRGDLHLRDHGAAADAGLRSRAL